MLAVQNVGHLSFSRSFKALQGVVSLQAPQIVMMLHGADAAFPFYSLEHFGFHLKPELEVCYQVLKLNS